MCNRGVFVCLALYVGLVTAPGISRAAGPKLKARLGELEQAQRPIFHFAVVADRTGGERHGVFPRAVKALNRLRPELVMSVGDMIEGYSASREIVSGQWDAMEKDLAWLKAPFYYTAGNHDISNPAMGKMFGERYGRPYYSFVHHDVLFVVLNSEQRHVEGGFEAQQEFLARTLEAHRDVRWTFVFFHQPVWRYRKPPEWWQVAAKLLADRRHTVFAGHWHRYAKKDRGACSYYTLATTGGGSDLSGPDAGSFDHVVWVTMTKDGPVIANLLLDGILPDDVMTEGRQALTDRIRRGAVWASPVLFERKPFTTGNASLTLRNPADAPMKLTMEIDPSNPLTVAPARWTGQIAPGAERELVLSFQADQPIDKDVAGEARVVWTAQIAGQKGSEVTVSGRVLIGLEVLHRCRKTNADMDVDAKLDDWPDGLGWHETVMQKLGRADGWTGREDCSYRIGTVHDDRYVYVAVQVRDDKHVFDRKTMPWSQDGVEVRFEFDPGREHPPAVRGKQMLLVALSGSSDPEAMVWFRRDRMPEGVKAACLRTDGGYVAEIAVPASLLDEVTGGPWKRFRLNVAVNDTDEPRQGTAKLWWRPDWRTPASYVGAGVFQRKQVVKAKPARRRRGG